MAYISGVLFLASLSAVVATNAAGTAFLAANKLQDGVVELPSGLQYKVLRKGEGTDHPTVNSPCECHYEGRTAANYPDGPEFDSSYKRGSTTSFAPNQVIKGWTEAMQLMVEGDKWEMYIPSELGYGDSGSPPKIGGGDVLVFTMEIIKINGGKVPASKCEVKSLEGCTDKEKDYVVKMKEKGAAKISAELKRLEGMKASAIAASKLAWQTARIKHL